MPNAQVSVSSFPSAVEAPVCLRICTARALSKIRMRLTKGKEEWHYGRTHRIAPAPRHL